MRAGPSAIVEDESGRFIVAQRASDEPALVFRHDGSFVATIGRAGDGPGEYRQIKALSVLGDQIYLYDEGNQRLSTVDQEFQFEGSRPLRGSGLMDALALAPDLHVVNMAVFDRSSAGYALHFVDRAGQIIRSVEPYDTRAGDPTAHFRHLFRDEDGGGFWSVPYFGRVILRRYSAEGKLLSEWSAPPSPGDDLPMSYGDPDDDRPPTRQILAAWHEGGRVWVVSMVPGDHWPDGLQEVEDSVHGHYYRPVDLDLVFDPMIEVFDPASGRLLAVGHPARLPVDTPVGSGIAAKLSTDELGWVFLHIRRAHLVARDSS